MASFSFASNFCRKSTSTSDAALPPFSFGDDSFPWSGTLAWLLEVSAGSFGVAWLLYRLDADRVNALIETVGAVWN
jgi:hypothetical protein